ncbi:MAG: hypothetical protein HC926_00540 [Synechococcaceae cyanobacterium SM2_3_60]|nr:hypothetical protein [Synechococcaceae cyanobacterium SM2_3_60]
MDWQRLQKALALEAEHGFCNLQGRQARFAEFVSEVLQDAPPEQVRGPDRRKWQELGARYGDYDQLAAGARAHLVQDTRRWLYQLRRSLEPPPEPRIPPASELDKGLQYLKGVGPIIAEKLARLGLLTVRDLLLYLPYEHISPAVQVLIKDLAVGERATVIATVKACTCFTSPKNQSLTILDLKVSDRSGWLKVSRFFAGRQFTNRGWQEKIKREYQRGATIAISGQVRQKPLWHYDWRSRTGGAE